MDLAAEKQRLTEELAQVRQALAQHARREAHLLGGLDVLERLAQQAPAAEPTPGQPIAFAGIPLAQGDKQP
jgi:hypothetical protein